MTSQVAWDVAAIVGKRRLMPTRKERCLSAVILPFLVTSNKARVKHGLSLLTNSDGSPERFDVLRPQRWRSPSRFMSSSSARIRSKQTPPSSTVQASSQLPLL